MIYHNGEASNFDTNLGVCFNYIIC